MHISIKPMMSPCYIWSQLLHLFDESTQTLLQILIHQYIILSDNMYNVSYNLLVRLELRSKIIVDTMNLKHVALLNILHYTGGILQYHSTSANYVRVWVIKCTGYDRPAHIDLSNHVCDRH